MRGILLPTIIDLLLPNLRENLLEWMGLNLMENKYIHDVDFSSSSINISPFGNDYNFSITAKIAWLDKRLTYTDVVFMLIVKKDGEIVCSGCSLNYQSIEEMLSKIEKEFETPRTLPCSCNN